MTATQIEDRLAEVHSRIERLAALEQADVTPERPRMRRHLDALKRDEASVGAAARGAPDEVEGRLGQLTTRLHVAEHSLAADIADNWSSFAAAVEAELRRWDVYLERLQTTIATNSWQARAEAEAAIGEIRSCRLEVAECLAQAREDGDFSEDARRRVTAARGEVEWRVDELAAKLRRPASALEPPKMAAPCVHARSGSPQPVHLARREQREQRRR